MSNNSIPVYFISGLGADCSAFDLLILPKGYHKVYLEWDKQYFKQPNMKTIAAHYSKMIITPDAIVVGLSFGGMILTEIALQRPKIRAILLSSIPSKLYFPLAYDWLLKFRLHKLVQKWQISLGSPVFKRIMNNTQDAPTLRKTQEMLDNTDIYIFKQSIEAMRTWKNTTIPANITQIHGNKDDILPKTHQIDYLVDGGSHFMVWEKAGTVSKILQHIILSYKTEKLH